MISKLTFDDIDSHIMQSDRTVLIGCLHRGDGYQEQKKIVEETAALFARTLNFYIATGDVLQTIMNIFDVRGTPTYLIIDKGNEIDRLLGQANTERLAAFIKHTVSERTAEHVRDAPVS